MATPDQIAAGVPASANIVAQVAGPNGQVYYLGSDGGVFATGGAQYRGGVNNLQGDSLAGQHQFGANAITYDPTSGGYRIVDTGGREYDFGGAKYLGGGAAVNAAFPAPNPLAQDPAFLAFMRTSGLGIGQAVSDYQNSVNQAAQARDAALRELDLNNPLSTASANRNTLLQGNVNAGRAGGVVQRDLTQYDTENAMNQAAKQQDYANAVGTAGNTLDKAVGNIATQGIEQGLNTGNSQGWNQFFQNEAAKYPDQATGILKSIGTNSGSTSTNANGS